VDSSCPQESPPPQEADRVEVTFAEGAPKTEDELRLYVGLAAGVVIPDVRVCRGHVSPWQAFCEAYFATAPVSVWKGSRGLAGKSFLLATLGWTEGTTLGCGVNVLGGSGEQSENVLKYHHRFWSRRSAPHHLLASDPSRRETLLTNGGRIAALKASQTSVRHGHPDRLRLDEVDEMDRKIFDASMGQTLERRGGVKEQTVISSTHQHADGTMSYVLKTARDRNWPIREWCYKESMAGERGWLTEAAVAKAKVRVPKHMWDVEYELQEPGVEGRAFDPDAIERMFRADIIGKEGEPLGEIEDENGRELIFEAPQSVGWYGTGGDWATSVDWTVIVTFRGNVSPRRMVAYLRVGRVPYPMIVPRFDQRARMYPGAACHDGSGVGVATGDYLTVEAEDVTLMGRERTQLFADYIAAVENGRLVAPMVMWMYREHKHCTWGDLFGGGHPPDSVVAGALAWRACERAQATVIVVPEAATKDSYWSKL
jgi:hypothetical protein